MKNLLLLMSVIFSAFFTFAQTPTDLFFSEYAEGSGNNKGVEIYNPTSQAIDLNNYYVARYSNGSSVFTEGGITHLVGTIEPYQTFILINGQTTSTPTSPACSPEMQALADQLDGVYPAPTYMNGNDAIALIKTTNGQPPSSTNPGIPVDLIGQIGLGNAISTETGWSYVQDSTLTYNNASGNPVTGKVINYIVQAKQPTGLAMVHSGCHGHQTIRSSESQTWCMELFPILTHLLYIRNGTQCQESWTLQPVTLSIKIFGITLGHIAALPIQIMRLMN